MARRACRRRRLLAALGLVADSYRLPFVIRPDFLGQIDEELRAFLHIAGIEFRLNPSGTLVPFLRRGGFDWVLYLHEGDVRSIDYWRQVALRGWREVAGVMPIVPSDRPIY